MRRNPANDFMMSALVSAAAGALAAIFNQKILLDPAARAMAEYRARNPGASGEKVESAAAVPKMLRQGAGRPLVNIAIGVMAGLAMDAWTKKGSAVHKAAVPFGAGFIAYGAALAVHDVIRAQNEKEAWYKSDVQMYAQSLAAPASTEALYNVTRMQQIAQRDLASGLRSTAGLYERA